MGIINLPRFFLQNEKQRYLPFVIRPSDKINSTRMESTKQGNDIPPQLFTFRTQKYVLSKGFSGGSAQLGVVPSTYVKHFSKDLTYKLLYPYGDDGTIKPDKISFGDLMNAMPGIQIREFLPDSKLDTVINILNEIIDALGDNVTKLIKEQKLEEAFKSAAAALEEKAKVAGKTFEKLFQNLDELLPWMMEYVFGETKPKTKLNLPGNKSLATYLFSDPKNKDEFPFYSSISGANNKFELAKSLMLRLPYQIYYKLQSCTTTNIYEIPFSGDKKIMHSSSGSAGWDGASGFAGKIIDTAATVVSWLMPSVGVSFAPWYDNVSGSKTPGEAVVVEFDLFNDNMEQAMSNFIFVNTIIPQNQWIQYGLFQHSPCLYDIKVEGIKRLFMCTGEFEVTSNGVLRSPTKKWIENLLRVHGNACLDETLENAALAASAAASAKNKASDVNAKYEDALYNTNGKDTTNVAKFQSDALDAQYEADQAANSSDAANSKINVSKLVNYVIENKTIKIPDVYHVKLTFKSLLPQNFNTFIMQYADNPNHITKYAKNSRDDSFVWNKIKGIGQNLMDALKPAAEKANNEASAPSTPRSDPAYYESPEYYNDELS